MPQWIELDGAVNVRDLGGLPTVDGRVTASGRLIRSDNLQGLSPRDVSLLVDELGVRTVADLRTGVEVSAEGPGPLHSVEVVEIRHLSLFPEHDTEHDIEDATTQHSIDTTIDGADAQVTDVNDVVLPWHGSGGGNDFADLGMVGVYLSYLEVRADSVLSALRLIAHAPGATIVHCAAGKDRTGTVVALALAAVGVSRAAIIADYALSAERIDRIFARLASSPTYAGDVEGSEPSVHAPQADTMQHLLDAIDARFGGVEAWLRSHGWTDADDAALHSALVAG